MRSRGKIVAKTITRYCTSYDSDLNLRPLKPVRRTNPPQTQLDGRLNYDEPVVLLPMLMPPEKKGFHLGLVCALCQFFVSKATGQISCGVVVCLVAVMTNYTGKCCLIWPVRSVWVVATMALL